MASFHMAIYSISDRSSIYINGSSCHECKLFNETSWFRKVLEEMEKDEETYIRCGEYLVL